MAWKKIAKFEKDILSLWICDMSDSLMITFEGNADACLWPFEYCGTKGDGHYEKLQMQ